MQGDAFRLPTRRENVKSCGIGGDGRVGVEVGAGAVEPAHAGGRPVSNR